MPVPVFEDQQKISRRPVKPKSWPIKLMMKMGVRDEKVAEIITIVISIILIIFTVIIYKQAFFTSPEPVDTNDLPPKLRQKLEAAGVTF